MRCILFLFALSVCLSPVKPLQAQPDPLKWGEVPREDLEMTHFPADSNASAVILADYGKVRFRSNGEVKFERHKRVKILDEAGYEQGTVTIPFYAEDNMERVRGIRGQTFRLTSDGEVQRHEMESDAIFEEEVDSQRKQMRFTLPALASGAVIEFRYEKRMKNLIVLPQWTFQSDEPTLWSEYRVEVPEYLHYVTSSRSAIEYAVQESEKGWVRGGHGTKYRWAVQDAPALREEPFMTTPNDYRARVGLQLHSYRDARGSVKSFMNSWQDLAEELMGMKTFGKEIGRHREVRHQTEALTASLEDPQERMSAVYDFVRRTIEWNGEMGFLLDNPLDDVLETKKGSSPEIALLLVSMLREAGLEAHPVLISTREHGQVQPTYPILRQFNDVLAYVAIGEEAYLLDATDPLRPYDLLPTSALNYQGLLLRGEGPEWIGIQPGNIYQHQTLVMARVDPSGTLRGSVEVTDKGYSALEKRKALEDKEPEEFFREVLLNELSDVQVHAPLVNYQHEVDKDLEASARFSASSYAQVAGDFIYINPMIVDRRTENPLRLPEREFPVDLAYPRHLQYTLNLEIPDGYAVHEHPQHVQIKLPDEGGLFRRLVQVQGGRLQLRADFVLEKPVFQPASYDALKEFFGRVVAAHNEQVVLRRVQERAGVEAGRGQ